MSVRAKCPHCGYITALHERALGRSLTCPRCEHEIRLPSKADVEAAKARKAAERKESAMAPRATTLQARPVKAEAKAVQVQPEPEKAPRLKKRKKKHAFNHEEAWDITPMVDVAFLLLIFFMVTGSFSIQKVIRTAKQLSDKPSSNSMVTTPQDASKVVTIRVDEQDSYVVVVDGAVEEAFNKQALILLLTQAKEAGGEDMIEVNVEAHEESTHGAVVSALDAARAAKFSKFKTSVVEQFN